MCVILTSVNYSNIKVLLHILKLQISQETVQKSFQTFTFHRIQKRYFYVCDIISTDDITLIEM